MYGSAACSLRSFHDAATIRSTMSSSSTSCGLNRSRNALRNASNSALDSPGNTKSRQNTPRLVAFWLERRLPAVVRGPVDLRALRRLAAMRRADDARDADDVEVVRMARLPRRKDNTREGPRGPPAVTEALRV